MEEAGKDAIQTTDDGDVIGTNNDSRLKMYAQINDQNDQLLAENGDLADVNDDGTTTAFKPATTLTDEEIAAQELQRAADEANAPPAADDTPPEPKHKIKVNGRELELTTAELLERAQKVEAADEYLKEAARLKREAEQRQQNTQQQPSVPDVEADPLEERRALVRAIQMGTEEEAMAAIEKLQARTTPSVNADDISRAVDERITFNDAVHWFQAEYKDLVGDQTLLNIVLQRDKELLASGDKRSYRERYEEIGKQVRDWRESLVKAAQPAETKPPVQDKQTRKASAPAVPSGASTKAPQAADDEEQDESVGDIIAAMAKARGGPQWLRG